MLDDPNVQAWLLIAVAVGCVVASVVMWRRRRAPPPAAAEPARAEPEPEPALQDAALGDAPEIEDGVQITPTRVTLVWERPGYPPEEYEMSIETVTRDGIVFAGTSRQLASGVVDWRMFHTLALPGERLAAVSDAAGRPISDLRGWLLTLVAHHR